MNLYILSKNTQITTGYHKIHKEECTRRPKEENTIKLGKFPCSVAAQSEARKYYNNVDGCSYCCKEIHLKK